MRALMRYGILFVGVNMAIPALAQTATGNKSVADSNQLAANSAGDAGGFTAGDIVVTAQRRSERARDVPISLTVASAEELARSGISNVRDLTLITPGLIIDRAGTATQPALRGITSIDNMPGNDANVAIYVDGVYQPVQQANTFEFPDIERVEVAKGPQGTLYGRNATGGAIQIFTSMPTYDFHGNAKAGYGNLDSQSVQGTINIPLVDQIAATTLTGFFEKNDGYFHNLVTGKDFGKLRSVLLRGKLLLQPTDRLSVLLTGSYSKRRDDSGAAIFPLGGNTVGRLRPGTIIPTDDYDVALNRSFFRIQSQSASAKVDLDLDFATITSTTAYQDANGRNILDSDFTSAVLGRFNTTNKYNTFSQELTLSSNNSGAIKWVGGVFYYWNLSKYAPLNVGGANDSTLINIFGNQSTHAGALFGEVTVDLTDRLTAIAGARYSIEKRELLGAFAVNLTPGPLPSLGKKTFRSFTPRASLRYAVTADTNIYATFSRGFKSGGFSVASLRRQPFDPEKVTAYEVGIKTAPDPSISLNAAAFYYDYTDQQVGAYENSPTAGFTDNAASSRIYGVEADARLKPSPELTFTAAISYLNAKYKSYPFALALAPRVINGQVCNCGNVNVGIDASGNHLIRAPEATVSLGGNYRREFSIGTIEANANLFYSNDFFFESANRVRQPSYVKINSRFSFTPAGSPFAIAFWVKNITNEKTIQGTTLIQQGDGVYYAAPRTYGAELSYRF